MTPLKRALFFSLWVQSLFNLPTAYALQSDRYCIPSAILSGGGQLVTSQSYQTETTIGQPSPLIEQRLLSEHYALYPGFWHTMGAMYGGPMPWLLLLLDDEQEMDLW